MKKPYSVQMPSEASEKKNVPTFGKKYPPKAAIQSAGSEVYKNEPAIVAKTRRKKGRAAARRQKIAIILSKARKGK